jgi:hypothetical protein
MPPALDEILAIAGSAPAGVTIEGRDPVLPTPFRIGAAARGRGSPSTSATPSRPCAATAISASTARRRSRSSMR